MISETNIVPKILIVDDNPLNIQMLELVLKQENLDIIKANLGSRALQLADEQAPDLIFLDIMMPQMDGFEVCRRLKANDKTKDIPVIYLTAKSDMDGIVKGFEVGAADYVTRPFNRVELLARMKTHLELKRSRDMVINLERRNSVLAMIATTNHEINQPLTVLSGNLFLLKNSFQQTKLNDEQKSSFKKMESTIMAIKNILAKYRNAASMRFEKYTGESKIVVFEENTKIIK